MTSEKTEQPTPKKLQDARKEGQVAHSKDLTQTVLVVALFGYMLADARGAIQRMGEMIILPSGLLKMEFADAAGVLLEQLFRDMAWLLLPYVLIVLGVGSLVEVIQTRFLIAFKRLVPSAKKLNIASNVKNIVSRKNLVEFLKSNAKIAVLCSVIWFVLDAELGALMTLPQSDLAGVGVALGLLLKSMIIKVSIAYAVIAAADFAWQWHHHHRQLMMTKDEVKRESKENEGDPHIKSERKQLHQDMLQEGAVERTRQASVVIVNPIHLAVAILYQDGRTPLPVVVAKGEGALARRMVLAARQARVPVLENVPLARALTEQARVDQYIPDELIHGVAEVLRLVRQMKED